MTRKRNVVHARRGFGKDDQPRISADHFNEKSVREAAEVAALVAARHPTRAILAGNGNFGVVYRVETPDGPRVVKIPATNDNHGVAWTRDEQTMWLRHEAGVANELAARGYTVVPRCDTRVRARVGRARAVSDSCAVRFAGDRAPRD